MKPAFTRPSIRALYITASGGAVLHSASISGPQRIPCARRASSSIYGPTWYENLPVASCGYTCSPPSSATIGSVVKTLALTLLISMGVVAGGAQAAVHATPQPEAPAVTAKPHLKTQAAKGKKKHKAPVKKKAKGKKKSTGKHTQTHAAGHPIH